jgi:hypothetical protein
MRAQLYGRVIVAITRHSHRRIVGRRSRVVVVLMHFSFPCVIVPARTHARSLMLDVEEDRLRCLRAIGGGSFASAQSILLHPASPLYPHKRTCAAQLGMSALGQCEHLRRELEKPAVCAALSLGRDLALYQINVTLSGNGFVYAARAIQLTLDVSNQSLRVEHSEQR